MRLVPPSVLAALLVSLMLEAGCSAPEATHSMPTLPVKGVVRYRGEPLEGGSISFEPADIGREAHGAIQGDGSYVVTTFKEGDGAVPGLHRIAIEGKLKGGKPVPVKFRNASSSKLEADVAEGKSEFNFDLK